MGLFGFEVHKLFRSGIWVILGCLVLKMAFLCLVPEQIDPRIKLSHREYDRYMQRWGGATSPEKEAEIFAELAAMDERALQSQTYLSDDETPPDQDAYDALLSQVREDTARHPSLEIFAEKARQFAALREAFPDAPTPYFFYEYGWRTVFSVMQFPELFLFAVALFLGVGSFCPEYQSGAVPVLRSTGNGRGRLFWTKIGSLALVLFAACGVHFLAEHLVVMLRFRPETVPLASVSVFARNPLDMNTWFGFGVLLLLRSLGAMLAGLLAAGLSVFLRSNVRSASAGLLVCLLPLVFATILPAWMPYTLAGMLAGLPVLQSMAWSAMLVPTAGTAVVVGCAGERWR